MKKTLSILILLTLLSPYNMVVFAEDIPTQIDNTIPSDKEITNIDTVAPNQITEDSIIVIQNDLNINLLDNLEENNLTDNQNINLQDSTDVPLIQDTYNTQDVLASEVLDSTKDKDITVVDENNNEVLPIISDTITEEKNTEQIKEEIPTEDTPVVIEEPINYLSKEELKPKHIHKFYLTNNKIKTDRKSKNTDKDNFTKGKKINNDIVPVVDNNSGSMEFSGSCDSSYFVVLLYKDKSDYLDNPNKYILNSAFPCINKIFNYKIEDLPNSLEDGIYYLLVGQQGDTGSWVPISDLTEININKS